MLKMFSFSVSETRIIATLHHNSNTSKQYEPCVSVAELEKTYQDMRKTIEYYTKRFNGLFKFEMEVTGKLDGKDINQTFENLDAYRKWLDSLNNTPKKTSENNRNENKESNAPRSTP